MRFIEAQANAADALRFLGHRGQPLDDGTSDAIARNARVVNELRPRAIWREFPIDRVDESGVVLKGVGFALPGSHIARHLRDAKEAVLLAVTLGADSERLLKRTACVSPADGLIVDACASSLVEEAANAATCMIAQEARARGLRAGKRFSPGYGDFPLAAQRDFLHAIDAERLLGIRLTEGDLMVPSKSITAVVPLIECGEADEIAEGVTR